MKVQEFKEIKGKPMAELQALLKESREYLRTLKFDLHAGKVKNVRELHSVKRYIAKILTALKQVTAK